MFNAPVNTHPVPGREGTFLPISCLILPAVAETRQNCYHRFKQRAPQPRFGMEDGCTKSRNS
nr:hypothetical protein RVX_0806 [Nitratidesulfovibrio sp. HK-II]